MYFYCIKRFAYNSRFALSNIHRWDVKNPTFCGVQFFLPLTLRFFFIDILSNISDWNETFFLCCSLEIYFFFYSETIWNEGRTFFLSNLIDEALILYIEHSSIHENITIANANGEIQKRKTSSHSYRSIYNLPFLLLICNQRAIVFIWKIMVLLMNQPNWFDWYHLFTLHPICQTHLLSRSLRSILLKHC